MCKNIRLFKKEEIRKGFMYKIAIKNKGKYRSPSTGIEYTENMDMPVVKKINEHTYFFIKRNSFLSPLFNSIGNKDEFYDLRHEGKTAGFQAPVYPIDNNIYPLLVCIKVKGEIIGECTFDNYDCYLMDHIETIEEI